MAGWTLRSPLSHLRKTEVVKRVYNGGSVSKVCLLLIVLESIIMNPPWDWSVLANEHSLACRKVFRFIQYQEYIYSNTED